MKNEPTLVFSSGTSNSSPLLSIVVAAYNHETYVAECLNSVLECEQASEIELIVIDDSSKDKTLNVVTDFLSTVEINCRVYTKPNRGLVDSLRIGLQIVTGRFVCFMASDDLYVSRYLDNVLVRLAELTDFLGAILYQAEYIGDLHGRVYDNGVEALFAKPIREIEKSLSLEYPKPMLLQSTVFSTSFLKAVDPWSDNLILDDWPTFLRVVQNLRNTGGEFVCDMTTTLCKYRVHQRGIHNNIERQLNACLQVARDVVAPEYRNESISNIYLDRSLNFLARGKVFSATDAFVRGIAANPSARAVTRVPKRVVAKLFAR